MSKFWHVLLHVVGVALQVVNVAVIPTPYQPLVAAAVAVAQGGLAVANARH